ncbi:MAG TPA: PIN domain-containing protein [Phycisphaerae bacterium]|nr:PIN domain-containing protein [Phycisphaerae bacterium]
MLDTSILLSYWNHRQRGHKRQLTDALVERWAEELIELHGTDAILTPIYIEVIVGTTTSGDLRLWEAFLAKFTCIDQWNILPDDWKEAVRFAKRIPRQTRKRKLGDCLIRAICKRLRYETVSHDKDFRI